MRRIASLFPVAVGVALAGSLWALMGTQGCDACGQASRLIGGVDLAPVGVLFYGALLLGALSLQQRGWLYLGACVAAGLHISLVRSLMAHGIACPPCLMTAIGAFAAAALGLAAEPARLRVAGLTLLGAALVGGIAMPAVERSARQGLYRQAQNVAGLALSQMKRPEPGQVRIVAFTRPGCPHCEEFRQQTVPEITDRYGHAVKIEARLAMDGLSTPTLVIFGAQDTVFLGPPPESELWQALDQAIGRPASGQPMTEGIPLRRGGQ